MARQKSSRVWSSFSDSRARRLQALRKRRRQRPADTGIRRSGAVGGRIGPGGRQSVLQQLADGKICRCGQLPTLFQLQVQYNPVRPDASVRRGHSAAGDADDSGRSSREPSSDQGQRSVQGRWAGVVATGDAPAVVSMPATVESTALQPRIDALRAILPEPRIRLGERVNFDVGELEAPVAQRVEGFERPLEKGGAKLLVCQNLPNDELHGSLHIYTPESSPVLGASSVAVVRSFAALLSWSWQEQPGCRRATGEYRPKFDEVAYCGGLNPSGSTRRARQRATRGAPATATRRRRAGGGEGRLAL